MSDYQRHTDSRNNHTASSENNVNPPRRRRSSGSVSYRSSRYGSHKKPTSHKTTHSEVPLADYTSVSETQKQPVKTSQSKTAPRKKTPPRKKRKGCLGGCLLPFILFILILICLAYIFTRSAFSSLEKCDLDMEQIVVNAEDENINDYQNIALFGVDNQDNVIGDTGSRTDCIIVASIHKSTKKVKLMSIYRDTYVSINGEYDKINAAYSYGGPELAISTINRNLDLDITDFATVNFKALADAVDVLGGIELTIQTEKELDNLNDYIGNMNKINGGDSPKFDDIGTYTFDGNQAVAYSRIRYMEGGDHARASHQRLVVEGIMKQAKRKPWKLGKLASTVLPQCKTSFSTNELSRMALSLLRYDIKDSQAYPFDSVDEKYYGIYYGFPLTAASNAIQAHEYLFGTMDYVPTDELQKISAKIEIVTDALGY